MSEQVCKAKVMRGEGEEGRRQVVRSLRKRGEDLVKECRSEVVSE